MRTIGFINWKGGVGKTTVSINSAYAFAEQGLRVLFIDADKQGNASGWFDADTRDKPTFSDILRFETPVRDVIQKTRYPNIDIIPADASLIQANYEVLKDGSRAQHDILKKALADVQFDYEICIIDNPPDSNLPVLNCLLVMDDIIAVTMPNRFSVAGVHQLQAELENYNRDLSLNLSVRGVLINQYTSECSEIFNELHSQYRMFPPLRGGKNTQKWLDRVINRQKSIFEISPHSGYALDLRRFLVSLANEIQRSMM